MKSYLVGIVFVLVVTQFNGLAMENNTSLLEIDDEFVTIDDFTHTVVIEKCTASWCPNCPVSTEALYNLYSNGEQSFFYISLVHDMNPNAKERLDEFTMGLYKGYAFPTIYLDGGIYNMVGGRSTLSQTEAAYANVIEEAGSRIPNKPLLLETSVDWLGDGKVKVTVDVTNTGNGLYIGKVRSYITEIESRWNDYDGNPYHYVFLDFAINKPIFLLSGKTQTLTAEWDGNQDHNGISFNDIEQENIQVITTVSHWMPSVRTGYESNTFSQKYLAFPVDQTDSAQPE